MELEAKLKEIETYVGSDRQVLVSVIVINTPTHPLPTPTPALEPTLYTSLFTEPHTIGGNHFRCIIHNGTLLLLRLEGRGFFR